MNLNKYMKEIRCALLRDQFDVTEDGILLFGGALRGSGLYVEGVNGQDWRYHKNLLVDEGIKHFLNVVLGSTSKISTWYLAPFSGAATPAAGWTAANFTSNATEITSTTEGYTESVRQTLTTTNASSSNQIDNYANKAAFTIATATSLTVTGIGLLSSNVRGGTTGTLISATKFGTARVLQNNDIWNVGYRVLLAST